MMGKKLVQGFGVNDVKTNTVSCPYYAKWADMIARVYREAEHQRYPKYAGCSVCEEWKYLSKFMEWVDNQPERRWATKHLDKDLLVVGNKIYSPESCVFVSSKVNTLFNDHGSLRGECLLGVTPSGSMSNPYRARCGDPLNRYSPQVGNYSTEIEAHLAWKSKKHEYALELVDLESDPRVKEVLRNKYKDY